MIHKKLNSEMTISPKLNEEEINFLNEFKNVRRSYYYFGPYYIPSFTVQEYHKTKSANGSKYIDKDRPFPGQPNLWCHWQATSDGKRLSWDEMGDFVESERWLSYLVEHFLKPYCKAKQFDKTTYSFLQGHTLNGTIYLHRKDLSELVKIDVKDNEIFYSEGRYRDPSYLRKNGYLARIEYLEKNEVKDEYIHWDKSVQITYTSWKTVESLEMEEKALATAQTNVLKYEIKISENSAYSKEKKLLKL